MDGPFGARVPAVVEEVVPEVLIVPLVAFDAKGYRLGYGGGFYDRTLECLRAARRTVAIGYAFSTQTIKNIPLKPTNQQLNTMITKTNIT